MEARLQQLHPWFWRSQAPTAAQRRNVRRTGPGTQKCKGPRSRERVRQGKGLTALRFALDPIAGREVRLRKA